MKDSYNSDDLVISNLKYISSEVTSHDSPMVKTTTQKYIFEKFTEKGVTKYREIFTGFVTEYEDDEDENYDIEILYFDVPYPTNIIPLKQQLSSIEQNISKFDLLFLLDEINTKNFARTLKR